MILCSDKVCLSRTLCCYIERDLVQGSRKASSMMLRWWIAETSQQKMFDRVVSGS
jgi:hypothetical protein